MERGRQARQGGFGGGRESWAHFFIAPVAAGCTPMQECCTAVSGSRAAQSRGHRDDSASSPPLAKSKCDVEAWWRWRRWPLLGGRKVSVCDSVLCSCPLRDRRACFTLEALSFSATILRQVSDSWPRRVFFFILRHLFQSHIPATRSSAFFFSILGTSIRIQSSTAPFDPEFSPHPCSAAIRN